MILLFTQLYTQLDTCQKFHPCSGDMLLAQSPSVPFHPILCQPPVLVVMVRHQVDYSIPFIQIQLISHWIIRVLLVTVRCICVPGRFPFPSNNCLPVSCPSVPCCPSISITVPPCSDELRSAVSFPFRLSSVELLPGSAAS